VPAALGKGLITLTPDRELIPESVALATKLKHPLADCLYLAVAIRSGAPLITADRSFQERAKSLYRQVTLLAGCEKN
jgi:predicted nucleic acid-binding protein